jgi:hypothetical protein
MSRQCRLPIILAALALVGALLLAGCSAGGSTRPGGYQCAAPQSPYGCYTQLVISHSHLNPDSNPDIPADPVAAESDMMIVPLTCDPACQASSGGGNPPGYIANFIQLYQQSAGWYIRIGYITTPSGLQYFIQYEIPGVYNNQFVQYYLGAPSPNYGYTTMLIGVSVDIPGDTHQWVEFIAPGGVVSSSGVIGVSDFQPDYLFYGQVVYGTSGATAQFSVLTNNYVFTKPYTFPNQFLMEDASPPATVRTVDHPTDAGWFFKASASSNGGMFYLSCCQP